MRKLEAVPNPTPEDEEIRAAAVKAGCTPIWANGILGWAWHCGCPDFRHAMDQQCTVIRKDVG